MFHLLVNLFDSNKQKKKKIKIKTQSILRFNIFLLHHSYYSQSVSQSPKVLQQINISSQFCVATKQFKKIKIFNIVRKLYHLSIKNY